MLLNVLRAFFVLIVVGVAMNYAVSQQGYEFAAVAVSLGLACLFIAVDILIPQKSLFGLSGLFCFKGFIKLLDVLGSLDKFCAGKAFGNFLFSNNFL